MYVHLMHFRFIAVAKLGDSEICNEKGHSKHEARIKAAERALQMLTIQVRITRGTNYIYCLFKYFKTVVTVVIDKV